MLCLHVRAATHLPNRQLPCFCPVTFTIGACPLSLPPHILPTTANMRAAASKGTSLVSCSHSVALCPPPPRTILRQRLRGQTLSVMALSWPFFSKKEDSSKGESKTRQLLTWARAAKPGTELAPAQAPNGLKLATFAGGCFWGLELAYQVRWPLVISAFCM